jgi:predicted nuclease with TOPRIM domain
MIKRKVQQPVKTEQIPKDKVEAAVKKVLNAPGSSKAAKTAKGSSLSSKPKSPTLKEQVSNWKERYATLSDDYTNLLNEVSRKDMEIANLRNERDTLNHQHHHEIIDFSRLSGRYDELNKAYLEKCLPWYTKLLNFFKGD